jgi:galactokinase
MPDTAVADAPGRVNLIGEHTDYHQGFVLPTIIPQRTRVTVTRRADRQVHAVSSGVATGAEHYEVGGEQRGRGWLDYVQGVTAMLARTGIPVSGFDLHIESHVPVGAGVSSSAALEVSLLRALRQLFALDIDDLTVARIAQAAETDFVGAPVGIMDQLASSLGRDGEALFVDTRTLEVERVPIPSIIDIAVIDSGITHAHAGGEYATRRQESFDAAARLGVDYLRDLDLVDLPRIDALPPVLARRARHIVTENQRVLAAVQGLRDGDAPALGALCAASHASMRDDYETSLPAIDLLVHISSSRADVYGARLTGGGFGGAVVVLAHAGHAAPAARDICRRYREETGNGGTVLVPSESVTSQFDGGHDSWTRDAHASSHP